MSFNEVLSQQRQHAKKKKKQSNPVLAAHKKKEKMTEMRCTCVVDFNQFHCYCML